MITTTQYKAVLSSDDYGQETFDYETFSEAMAGAERLVKSAKNYTQKDQIKRRVELVVSYDISSAFN